MSEWLEMAFHIGFDRAFPFMKLPKSKIQYTSPYSL